MNVRDIVRKAWQVTQVHLKKLIWYGSVPAFFSTVVSSVYLSYQYFAFKSSALFGGEAHSSLLKEINTVWQLVASHPKATIFVIVLAAIVFVGYTLTPPTFRGTLIYALMKIKNYEPITGSFEIGLRRFFPMFEFGVIVGSFSIITIFTESSFILRWWGVNVFFIALPVLLFVAAVGLIANFLFTYSEYFIVLEDMKIIKALKESVILVISNLRKTFLIFLLMLLIGVRVILNVVLILFVPMGVVFLGAYFAAIFSHTIGLMIIGLIALSILLVASYLMGLFNVFSTAVWVFTYAELTRKGKPVVHHEGVMKKPMNEKIKKVKDLLEDEKIDANDIKKAVDDLEKEAKNIIALSEKESTQRDAGEAHDAKK